MKVSLTGLALLLATQAPASMAAERYLLQSPGAQCQPAEPRYAAYIDHLDGGAMAHADVVVSCALPAVPPGYVKTAVTVSLLDLHRSWGKQGCRAHNLYGNMTGAAPIVPIRGREHLAEASWPVDPRGVVPHAVVCELRAGQKLYALQVEVAPE